MEKDGKKFYRELAGKTDNKPVARVLEMMANDEVKHYHTFLKMQSGIPEMDDTKVLIDAKNIFQRMKDECESINTECSDLDLFEKARDVELESKEFYLTKAEEATEKANKKLWISIAKEEAKHYFLLEHLIEFLTKPKHWLENSEFVHLEEF